MTPSNNDKKLNDEDLCRFRKSTAEWLYRHKERPSGVSLFMGMDCLPDKIEGSYPIVLSYKLPGIGITTSEFTIYPIYKQK